MQDVLQESGTNKFTSKYKDTYKVAYTIGGGEAEKIGVNTTPPPLPLSTNIYQNMHENSTRTPVREIKHSKPLNDIENFNEIGIPSTS